MSISNNILDRDKAAYKENVNDGGLDRRVTDVNADAKLDDVINLLQQIDNNTDNLEITAENINLNTDTLEALITSTNTLITNKTQWTKLTDGTNDATIKASTTQASITDTAVVTALRPFNYTHIKAAATTTIKSGSGVLNSIIMTTAGNGTFTVYDNTTGAGTIIALITTVNGTNPTSLIFNVEFTTGLTIVSSSANPSITTVWR